MPSTSSTLAQDLPPDVVELLRANRFRAGSPPDCPHPAARRRPAALDTGENVFRCLECGAEGLAPPSASEGGRRVWINDMMARQPLKVPGMKTLRLTSEEVEVLAEVVQLSAALAPEAQRPMLARVLVEIQTAISVPSV